MYVYVYMYIYIRRQIQIYYIHMIYIYMLSTHGAWRDSFTESLPRELFESLDFAFSFHWRTRTHAHQYTNMNPNWKTRKSEFLDTQLEKIQIIQSEDTVLSEWILVLFVLCIAGTLTCGMRVCVCKCVCECMSVCVCCVFVCVCVCASLGPWLLAYVCVYEGVCARERV